MGLESVRSLGHRTDLVLLERSGSTVVDHGDHWVVRTPDNPAFWWGNFVLLRDAPAAADTSAWVARFEAHFPHAEHRAFGVDGTRPGVVALAGFAAAGYEVAADTVMTATAVRPPARPHTGAALRRLESDEDWLQHTELALSGQPDEETRERERPFVTARGVSQRRLVETGGGAWFGAFVDGRLVAQLGLVPAGRDGRGCDEGGMARFQEVETHPAARGQGLASALVHHASEYGFGELGASTLVMVADPGYAAIRIYRALGFTDTEQQVGASLSPRAVAGPGSGAGSGDAPS